jgi:hypothetical protein
MISHLDTNERGKYKNPMNDDVQSSVIENIYHDHRALGILYQSQNGWRDDIDEHEVI